MSTESYLSVPLSSGGSIQFKLECANVFSLDARERDLVGAIADLIAAHLAARTAQIAAEKSAVVEQKEPAHAN